MTLPNKKRKIDKVSKDDTKIIKDDTKTTKATTKTSKAPAKTSKESTKASKDNPKMKDAHGSTPIITTLYQQSSEYGKTWVEKKPPEVPSATITKFKKAAILVRKVPDIESTIDGHYIYVIEAIRIQSPHIINACRQLFVDAGILLAAAEGTTISFVPPFKILYFSYESIVEKESGLDEGSVEKEHLSLLIDLLDQTLEETKNEVAPLIAEGLMSFKHLWTLFPKGTIVYSKVDGQDRLFKVVEADYCSVDHGNYLRINGRFVRFDGVDFGWAQQALYVDSYKGNARITSLDTYPISFRNDTKELEERMEVRGRKVLDFQDIHYQQYEGSARSIMSDSRYNVSELDLLSEIVLTNLCIDLWQNNCRHILTRKVQS